MILITLMPNDINLDAQVFNLSENGSLKKILITLMSN